MWTLTLIFTCCGMPLSVVLPSSYPSHQACDEAGKVWLKPESNPVRTVRRYSCSRSTVRNDYGCLASPRSSRPARLPLYAFYVDADVIQKRPGFQL
jgi:hypothetical protein